MRDGFGGLWCTVAWGGLLGILLAAEVLVPGIALMRGIFGMRGGPDLAMVILSLIYLRSSSCDGCHGWLLAGWLAGWLSDSLIVFVFHHQLEQSHTSCAVGRSQAR